VKMTNGLPSRYCFCLCDDCSELTFIDENGQPQLCSDCRKAGCDPNAPTAIGRECKVPGAYGTDEVKS